MLKINNYYKAKSIEDAYKVLLEDEKNIVIGGGAWLKLTNKQVSTCIDIAEIGLIDVISYEDKIEIGAMTSLRQIEKSDEIKQICSGILSDAISQIMGIGIRNIWLWMHRLFFIKRVK